MKESEFNPDSAPSPVETVEKHANSDVELAEGPEFERGTGRFDTSTLLSAGMLNVRFIPFSTVSSRLFFLIPIL
ncbi:MAG: hypothetical protein H6696_17230 [Deferribacteres bacterium]|nr:hypothetical protein [candidate division KSB1 bacterium]MCB9503679.1 hypothetical protein [Deferribacteres bacterium]